LLFFDGQERIHNSVANEVKVAAALKYLSGQFDGMSANPINMNHVVIWRADGVREVSKVLSDGGGAMIARYVCESCGERTYKIYPHGNPKKKVKCESCGKHTAWREK